MEKTVKFSNERRLWNGLTQKCHLLSLNNRLLTSGHGPYIYLAMTEPFFPSKTYFIAFQRILTHFIFVPCEYSAIRLSSAMEKFQFLAEAPSKKSLSFYSTMLSRRVFDSRVQTLGFLPSLFIWKWPKWICTIQTYWTFITDFATFNMTVWNWKII